MEAVASWIALRKDEATAVSLVDLCPIISDLEEQVG